jgi:hypothetical protein
MIEGGQVIAMAGITALVIAWRIIDEQRRAVKCTVENERRMWLQDLGADCRAAHKPCDGCMNGCGCYGGKES